MKTPQLWVTIDKRGFSKEGLKKLLEYNIAGKNEYRTMSVYMDL